MQKWIVQCCLQLLNKLMKISTTKRQFDHAKMDKAMFLGSVKQNDDIFYQSKATKNAECDKARFLGKY